MVHNAGPNGIADMPFNPLIIVVFLLGVAGLVSISAVGEPMGIGLDRTLQIAVVHAEFAACVLLLFPRRGNARKIAALNLLNVAACFAAASACVMLIRFAALGDLPWQTRAGALAAWAFAGGVLALGARVGADWVARARIAVLCVFAVPALAHYLALEYAGASLLHLRGLSPSWAFAAGELSWLPLLPAGVLPWVLAFALPARGEAA
jgi:hypothetical protein